MNKAIFFALFVLLSAYYAEAEPVAETQGRVKGFIYVLKEGAGRFYKIGFTTSTVAKRIKQLQTGNPRKITEVFSQKVSDVRAAEQAAKAATKKFHAHGSMQGGTEWYDVATNKYSGFLGAIKAAINRFKAKKVMLLQQLQAMAQMIDQA